MRGAKQNNGGAKQSAAVVSGRAAVINPNMVDLTNDPFFVKKAGKAKKMLTKYGVPGKVK